MLCCPMCRTFFTSLYEEGDLCPTCGQEPLVNYEEYFARLEFLTNEDEENDDALGNMG